MIALLAGCATPPDAVSTQNPNPNRKRTQMMDTTGELVVMDLGRLSASEVALQQEGAGLIVEQKEDDNGKYSLIKFIPNADTPKWTATRVSIPQVAFPNGAEWAEIEMWSSGAPLRIIADGTDKDTECFELMFCNPDVSWTGWKTYRTSLRTGTDNLGDGRLEPYTVRARLRIKYILVIMRQGKPWELGLRKMTVRLDREQ
jgi:hypothetical protein